MYYSDTIADGTLRLTLETAYGATATAGATPPDILQFLARLRLLEGVPFNTLVPDPALLPAESIRFFYLDRGWTDALVQGALAVATANTIERAQLEARYPAIEAEIDATERRIRTPKDSVPLTGAAGEVTGFLLRSAAVAGWPGLHVRAYASADVPKDAPEDQPGRIKLLRLDRLAPAVLLALFDGVPAVVQIEEPRQGVQFGTRSSTGPGGRRQAFVPARDVRTAGYVDASGAPVASSAQAAQIPVRFRAGAAGVVDLTNTARAFAAARGTGMTAPDDSRIDGAEFAVQMLRYPYQQVFARAAVTPQIALAAFRPRLARQAQDFTQALTTPPPPQED